MKSRNGAEKAQPDASASGQALIAFVCLLLFAGPWVAWSIIEWSEQQAYERLAGQGRDRLTLYGAALHSEFEKSRNVPLVLTSDREVVDLLAGGPQARTADRLAAFNRRLQSLNEASGESAIYLLDQQGLTLAASNWSEGAGSFVGQRFDFRPYFNAAMEGQVGRYFALGSTSNLPGYYVAMPVLQNARPIGAVVVKTVMDDLEHGWSGGGERVFVTDRHGIVFLTNRPSWRFRTLAPLSPAEKEDVQASRQYGDAPLVPLGLVAGTRITWLDGKGYVMVSEPLVDGDGWTLNVLLSVDEIEARARDGGLLAAAAMALTLSAIFFFVHRGRLLRRYARDLEVRVAERTGALTDTNRRLQAEVVERQRAEEDLKAKQDELVQATKMAALGQMSAGMVHEINQPLAAIRSYADNAVTLLGLGRNEQTRDNLAEIANLTERMARITGQLKLFARKSSGRVEPVPVGVAVGGALALMGSRLKQEGVELVWDATAAELWVWGDEVRLQQVLINLVRNALDAMREASRKRLSIAVEARGGTVVIDVADSGPGIAPEVMAHLFDPFFTTKPGGEGLGLGLSISEGIMRDFGGQLTVRSPAGGGAVFTMTLRRADLR